MTIVEGYGSKPLTIRIVAGDHERTAELRLEHPELLRKGVHEGGFHETLHYITIEELLDLKEEINAAIKALAGV